MPHIRLDSTPGLVEDAAIREVLGDLVVELARHDTIQPAAIKAYHTLRAVWSMGEGAPSGFVHCEVAILTGRPLELRKAIASGIETVLRRHFARSLADGAASLTVEVREMDRDTYVK